MAKYKHYKGGIYTVIGAAKHTSNLENLTLYSDKKGDMWARPTAEFCGTIKIEGKTVQRFEEL